MAQVLSGHGCFKAYLRRFKKKDEMCCYCNFPVDTAEHALFVCAKWVVAREVLAQAAGAEVTPDTMVPRIGFVQFSIPWTFSFQHSHVRSWRDSR